MGTPVLSEAARIDGRRAAGARTRARIIDAVQSLMAERDPENISLRDITEAAEANVASVRYYFGSKDDLCDIAVAEAIGTFAKAIAARLVDLRTGADVSEIAEALVKTIIAWNMLPECRERRLALLSARTLLSLNGSPRWERATKPLFSALHARLKVALPHLKSDELTFRAHAAMTILRATSAGVIGYPTAGRSGRYLIKLLLPAVTGCLAGSGPVLE